ncbi:MAG TPA: ABC-type transport auxiliary lipoprotein family protein [Bordetella sp.]
MKRVTERRMKGIGALCLALALAGCSVGKVGPAPVLYDLGADDGAAVSGGAARKPIALAFDAAPALGDTGMIWRVGGSASPKAYARAKWSVSPAELVRQRLVERLSRLGPVLSEGAAGLPRLQVTLTRFEQVFAADGTASTGQVSLQAVLLQADGRVLAQKLVQRSAAAATQDAEGGARALRQATDGAADELSAWLGGALR